jgi:hypothetical protein
MARSTRITIVARLVVIAVVCLLLVAHEASADPRKPDPIPNPPPRFGPSYQSPYNFAPPAPIYPTPGGELFNTPYQGGNGYARERAAPPTSPRDAPKSERLDTRLGPAR